MERKDTVTMTLPKKYQQSMQDLLGEEYPAYIESMQQRSQTAIRINTAKISLEQWAEICPFETKPIPWTEKGFLTTDEQCNPAKHPYYYAGLYYIQEPSAMIPASILPVHEGDRILDVCAAPGGKATELAAKLRGTGQLVANDISVSRAMALAKNLQIAGAVNAVVTAEKPERLQEFFSEYFDGILIDAPCSGEGMFRRDPHMVQDWEEKGPQYYAPIQRDILKAAYQMLREGGYLVYSTCTFSPEEDEKNILWFLRQFPDMHVCEVPHKEGFCSGITDAALTETERQQLSRCVRIFPHKAVGEGHFAVLLQKGDPLVVEQERNSAEQTSFCVEQEGNFEEQTSPFIEQEGNSEEQTSSFADRAHDHNIRMAEKKRQSSGAGRRSKYADAKQQHLSRKKDRGMKTGDNDPAAKAAWWSGCLSVPEVERYRLVSGKKQFTLERDESVSWKGLRCIQTGLIVGSAEKRFEPSIQLALAIREKDKLPYVNLSSGEQDVIRYLKGETLQDVTVLNEGMLKQTENYVLVCVDGFALGWGKYMQNGMLKNKYYAGWRMQ